MMTGAGESTRVGVRVLLFGAAREAASASDLSLTLEGPATARDVLERVLADHPALRRLRPALLVAVNQEYVRDLGAPVEDGSEVAIFPPVSGGSEGEGGGDGAQDFFELTTGPIDVGSVARRVVPRRCGATVTLDGYAREFTAGRGRTLYLVYEAYAPMALAEMRRLGREAQNRFDIAHIGIVHRT